MKIETYRTTIRLGWRFRLRAFLREVWIARPHELYTWRANYRRMKQMQALLRQGFEREVLFGRDRATYGFSAVDTTGERIDPAKLSPDEPA